MRHRRVPSMVLLASCSQCSNNFRDGAPRHLLGCYPMEQFCSSRCAERYLKNTGGSKRAAPVPPDYHLKGILSYPE